MLSWRSKSKDMNLITLNISRWCAFSTIQNNYVSIMCLNLNVQQHIREKTKISTTDGHSLLSITILLIIYIISTKDDESTNDATPRTIKYNSLNKTLPNYRKTLRKSNNSTSINIIRQFMFILNVTENIVNETESD